VRALAAPFTVNTVPEQTLNALAVRTDVGEILPADGGNSEEVLAQFARAGIDVNLAKRLQEEGVKAFVNSWTELLSVIAFKSAGLAGAA
jgi:transaldolase